MLPVSLTFGDSGLRCYKDHAQVMAGLAVQRDVAYGSECEQRLDVYHLGNQDVGNQIVLFLHGGGWVSGDKKCADSVPMLVELRRRGWVTSSVLLPDATTHLICTMFQTHHCCDRTGGCGNEPPQTG